MTKRLCFFIAVTAPFTVFFTLGVFGRWLERHVSLPPPLALYLICLVPGAVCMLIVPGWSKEKRIKWAIGYFLVMGVVFVCFVFLLYNLLMSYFP